MANLFGAVPVMPDWVNPLSRHESMKAAEGLGRNAAAGFTNAQNNKAAAPGRAAAVKSQGIVDMMNMEKLREMKDFREHDLPMLMGKGKEFEMLQSRSDFDNVGVKNPYLMRPPSFGYDIMQYPDLGGTVGLRY